MAALLAFDAWNPGMQTILQCVGLPHTTKKYPFQIVNSASIEKPWAGTFSGFIYLFVCLFKPHRESFYENGANLDDSRTEI